MRSILIAVTLLLSLSSSLYAAVEVKKFDNPQQEQRYKKLIDELRCLVCQNQNLADSNASLAVDLRKQVYKMISEGQSDKEIMDFMVTRYGDFVLYRPPFKTSTFFLWVGPFIIFVIGLIVLIRFIRLRKNVVTTLTDDDKEKLKQLLDQDKEQTK
ncbi:MAG: cytochrome c-type biogenesis protein CcmH [Gammaproteobacteria bacterium]|nr:cytochrome c-type biogenesis protein CcmH [Gammaproteobacteria bacterium]